MSGPVMAVDPGPEKSAWAVWCPNRECVLHGLEEVNEALLKQLRQFGPVLADQLVIERPVVLGGKAPTAALLETSRWAGVFEGAWLGPVDRITYHRVRSHLTRCGNAKESVVRQAIISRFAPGGWGPDGKGTKKAPGPFYGVTGHMWSAVAVAVAWCDLFRLESDSGYVVG